MANDYDDAQRQVNQAEQERMRYQMQHPGCLLSILLLLALLALAGCADPLGATTRTQIESESAVRVAAEEGKAAVGVAQAQAKADIAAANARPRVAFWLAGAIAVCALAFAWAHVERSKAQSPKPPQITVIVQAGALPSPTSPLSMALPSARRRAQDVMIVEQK